jgi:hypothetical protein
MSKLCVLLVAWSFAGCENQRKGVDPPEISYAQTRRESDPVGIVGLDDFLVREVPPIQSIKRDDIRKLFKVSTLHLLEEGVSLEGACLNADILKTRKEDIRSRVRKACANAIVKKYPLEDRITTFFQDVFESELASRVRIINDWIDKACRGLSMSEMQALDETKYLTHRDDVHDERSAKTFCSELGHSIPKPTFEISPAFCFFTLIWDVYVLKAEEHGGKTTASFEVAEEEFTKIVKLEKSLELAQDKSCPYPIEVSRGLTPRQLGAALSIYQQILSIYRDVEKRIKSGEKNASCRTPMD